MSSRQALVGLPNGSALAWQITRMLQTRGHSRRACLLVPDNVWALNLKDDLNVLAPNLPVHFLPALETDLLRNRGPSLLRRVERIRAFSALVREDSAPSVFLLPLEALMQKAPDANFWQKNQVRITLGEALERSDVTDRLVELGYTPVELVESPTEFAVRGSIVDVFPPTCEHPVRIELFEDQVQSLRYFHPESQRRLSDLDSLAIGPAREFLYPPDDDGLLKLKQKLRQYLDDRDWDKQDRDALQDRLQQRSFFPTVDYWAPLIRSLSGTETSLLEGLLRDSDLFLVEPGSLETEWPALFRSLERNFESARVEGDWVPDPADFLRRQDEVRASLESALGGAQVSLSCRQRTGLRDELTQKSDPGLRSHEVLVAKLSGARLENVEEPLAALAEEIRFWNQSGIKTVFLAPTPSQLERLQFLLGHYSIRFKIHESLPALLDANVPVGGVLGTLQQGFLDPAGGLSLVLDDEVFGTRKKRAGAGSARKGRTSAKEAFSADFELLDLKPGDYVVHEEHGVGRYLGLRVLPFHGIPSELVEIEYKDGSKLLLPVTRLNLIHKHSGVGDDGQLDKLGGSTWETKKAKVKRDLRNLAGELLVLYSKREMSKAPEIRPDKLAIDAFAGTFPFVETPDQAAAIEKTLEDLRGPRPMDRLVCGDVGYGKTEVSLRAAHAALSAGHQVVVLVPTTILAAQHENTFRKRLEPLGFKVAGLSRFKSTKESKDILARAATGDVHVLIGTHRLLSSDVHVPKLGLLIVDEEQRFGVAHKEKMKRLKANVHVLTLSATPIPRTLNMAMSGLKEISIISTPPADRLSVRTHVAKKKEALVQEAIQTELKRGGQVFYVHNRIQTMPKELEELQRLLPGVSIEWAHGQMEEELLERRMMNFYEGRTQVLLTTAIIESGLDIPNANTLIVDRADMFGLAQLYQIRGRVGRSSQRAFAYFLIPEKAPLTHDAEERLAVLESYQELGSGFHIASHDLELRGAGDLLGGSQSGHILSIGIDAYMELLQEAVAESRGEALEPKVEPEINLGIDTTIPEPYIPDIGLRLQLYRKAASAQAEDEIDAVESEIDDRFGPPPPSVRNLLAVMRVKCQLKRLGVRTLTAGKSGYSLVFDPSTPVNPAKLVASLKRYPALFHMQPDGKLLIKKSEDVAPAGGVMQGIEGALSMLESWCG